MPLIIRRDAVVRAFRLGPSLAETQFPSWYPPSREEVLEPGGLLLPPTVDGGPRILVPWRAWIVEEPAPYGRFTYYFLLDDVFQVSFQQLLGRDDLPPSAPAELVEPPPCSIEESFRRWVELPSTEDADTHEISKLSRAAFRAGVMASLGAGTAHVVNARRRAELLLETLQAIRSVDQAAGGHARPDEALDVARRLAGNAIQHDALLVRDEEQRQ